MELILDESSPIYQQIMKAVLWDIATGRAGPGDKLPSVRDMSKAAKANPNTVQRAYLELERMGAVETQRGQGTFVAADPRAIEGIRMRMTEDAVSGFVAEMRRLRHGDRDIVSMIQAALVGEIAAVGNRSPISDTKPMEVNSSEQSY